MAGARTKAPRKYERSSPGALFLCEIHTASSPMGRWMNGVLIVYGKAVDAALYLGSLELLLKEPMPADIAFDTEYRKELERRQSLPGIPAVALCARWHHGQGIRGRSRFGSRELL